MDFAEVAFFVLGLFAFTLAWLSSLVKQKHDQPGQPPEPWLKSLLSEIGLIQRSGWIMFGASLALYSVLQVKGCSDNHTQQAAQQKSFDDLNTSYTALNESHKTLHSDYKALHDSHKVLIGKYEVLQKASDDIKTIATAQDKKLDRAETLNQSQSEMLAGAIRLVSDVGELQQVKFADDFFGELAALGETQTLELGGSKMEVVKLLMDHYRLIAIFRLRPLPELQGKVKKSVEQVHTILTADLAEMEGTCGGLDGAKDHLDAMRKAVGVVKTNLDGLSGPATYDGIIGACVDVPCQTSVYSAQAEWLIRQLRIGPKRKAAPQMEAMLNRIHQKYNGPNAVQLFKPVSDSMPMPVER